MKYRKEIDGLRAIAIIPVVLFHFGIDFISGGFLGVDIFFVISGYLITSIIISELKQNRFSLKDFYERRARRILPALFFVLVITTIISILILPPNILKEYSQSLVSVATFTSNIFFYLEGDYFGPKLEDMPLLHTWSLAVEEQFYLFFPLLLILVWKNWRNNLVAILFIISFISLISTQFFIENEDKQANFYLIFSRAWELLAGSLIALTFPALNKISTRAKNSLSMLGLIITILSLLFFNSSLHHPSYLTLIPIIGTSLLIAFSNGNNLSGRFLSNRFFVRTGLLSYSLYLWHQPILVFIKSKSIGEPEIAHLISGVLLSYFLAYLSLISVEKPFRNKAFLSQNKIFAYSLIFLSITLTVGFTGHIFKGFPNRFDTSHLYSTQIPSPKRKECHSEHDKVVPPSNSCEYYGKNINWAVFGDSHAIEPAFAISEKIQNNNQGLVHLSFSACPPAFLFESSSESCTAWMRESLDYLLSKDKIKNVVLAFRHSQYLHGDQLSDYPSIPDLNPSRIMSQKYEGLTKQNAQELYWESFTFAINKLLDAGKKVYVLFPVPELPLDIEKIITPVSVFNENHLLDLQKTTDISYYKSRHWFILEKLNNLQYNENLKSIEPIKGLCAEHTCSAVINNTSLYFDDDHLSIIGARIALSPYNLLIPED